jgi:dTDP-4-dehydrorhamnose reductase
LIRWAIIGSRGQVGQALLQVLQGADVTPLDRPEWDVRTLRASLPFDVVINLAVVHPAPSQDDAGASMAVNAVGAYNVARAARRVVFVSTDYVFAGDQSTPYRPLDAVAPLSTYGISKAAGEHLVRMANPNHLIVRTSSVFGGACGKGYTFPEAIRRRARAGESIRAVADQFMKPTYAPDLALGIVRAVTSGATGTVHMANSPACSWHDFAVAALQSAGLAQAVAAVPMAEFPSAVPRPAFSVLACDDYDLGPWLPRLAQ